MRQRARRRCDGAAHQPVPSRLRWRQTLVSATIPQGLVVPALHLGQQLSILAALGQAMGRTDLPRRALKTAQPHEPLVTDAKAACLLDRVNRHFQVDWRNQRSVADFTYISSWQGSVYVAFVIGGFARRIVDWRANASMPTDFVLDALEQATYARRRERESELEPHSDRGLHPLSQLG